MNKVLLRHNFFIKLFLNLKAHVTDRLESVFSVSDEILIQRNWRWRFSGVEAIHDQNTLIKFRSFCALLTKLKCVASLSR